jgi:hypothetical protein
VKTAEGYTHVMEKEILAVNSPLNPVITSHTKVHSSLSIKSISLFTLEKWKIGSCNFKAVESKIADISDS